MLCRSTQSDRFSRCETIKRKRRTKSKKNQFSIHVFFFLNLKLRANFATFARAFALVCPLAIVTATRLSIARDLGLGLRATLCVPHFVARLLDEAAAAARRVARTDLHPVTVLTIAWIYEQERAFFVKRGEEAENAKKNLFCM